MNGLETAFWRLDADPLLRADVVMIWFLDRAPDWEAFLTACTWALHRLPRLLWRVAESPLRWGRASWEPDTAFDLAAHVRRMVLPQPAGRRELLRVAEAEGAAVFDPARPPWRAVLVEGMEGDRSAVVMKFHHSIADGAAVQQAMDALLPRSRKESLALLREAPPAAPVPVPSRSALGAAAALATSPLRIGRLGGEVFRTLAHGALTPRSTLRQVSELTAGTGHALTAPRPSPLLAGRSRGRHFDAISLPLDRLKAAGHSADASVTAAYIAILMGALREYHLQHGAEHQAVSLVVPVNLRTGGATRVDGNNIVAPVRLTGSLTPASAHEAIRSAHHLLRWARRDAVVRLTPALTTLLPLLPPSVLLTVTRRLNGAHDLVTSSVPGTARPCYLAGARITSMAAIPPRINCACTTTLVSHERTCELGLNIDPMAITAVASFQDLLRQSADRVLALPR
ncbi:wax ester/triacylglycerol synthase domain-containing protein [Spirillospora sp. CA-253888]